MNTITKHMFENNLGEPLQSAYRAAHSTEMASLKVKDDIMTSLTIGRVSSLYYLT